MAYEQRGGGRDFGPQDGGHGGRGRDAAGRDEGRDGGESGYVPRGRGKRESTALSPCLVSFFGYRESVRENIELNSFS